MNMEFKDRLKMIRQSKNITQTIAAKKLGISRQSLSNYENGFREPDIATICRLAEFYGVTTDELLGAKPIESPVVAQQILELAKTISNLPAPAKKLVEEQIKIFVDMNNNA